MVYFVQILIIQCSCFIDCFSFAVLAGPYQGNQAADPQYVPSLSLSLHVISQADDGGLVWVGVCDSVSGSVVLTHLQIQQL